MSLTNCRFYEEKYPEIDSFVMVNVRQIAEMGAYVKLLEYDEIDGMILLSELSRRRIRSIQKLIRVGRNEVVVVLRVDKDKGMLRDATWTGRAMLLSAASSLHQSRTERSRMTPALTPLPRLHRPLQTPRLPRRHHQMRRALQQVQNGAFHPAPRRRKVLRPHRRPLHLHRLAPEQEIRPRRRRLQTQHHKPRRLGIQHVRHRRYQE